MNLAVRLVATGVGLADAVGLAVDRVKLLSPFLHPVTKSGNTDRNTNKQRRIQICRTLYHGWGNCEAQIHCLSANSAPLRRGQRLIDVIEMLFDRTKLHESASGITLVISVICRTSCRKSELLFRCIRQRALLLHWPGWWLLVGLERPKQVFQPKRPG